ncbi:MAG TPA: glutamine-hydrolyzing GMP synthase, partial [Polyangiaceae bacterium]|nr:glutamine-hydrolyzing GMP synthase [Polyangiaceae bacterium]
MASARHNLVLIVDFGAQTSQLIARRVRESGVYCEIHRPEPLTRERLEELAPKAIIFSGGPKSVYDPGAPTIGKHVFELGVPILGICYGVQLMAHLLGGAVERADRREFGAAMVEVERSSGIFDRFDVGQSLEVWMSHGDRIIAVPPGFVTLAKNPSTPACAIGNPERRIYGVQFHPEVTHTPDGAEMIAAFLFDVAGIDADWTPASFV